MKTLLMLTALAFVASWSTFALAEDNGTSAAPVPAPTQQQDSSTAAPDEGVDNKADGLNECWSSKKCLPGKILNHKDRHNCKNSGGKSWRDGHTGTCYNL